VTIPYMHTVDLEQVHPFCYISLASLLLLLFFKRCLVGSLCFLSLSLSLCVCVCVFVLQYWG
jgi:hypothetical protein